MTSFPILKTSENLAEGLEEGDIPEGHRMLVDRVVMALQQSFHGSDAPDQFMSDSEENDEC